MQKEKLKRSISKLLSFFPDVGFLNKFYISIFYGLKMKRKLDFKNLKTLNEKMQCLKLNSYSEKYTKVTDKVLVRDYIESKVGSDYLIPMYHTGDDVNLIDESIFPNCDVIFKVNHDCSGGLIIKGLDNEIFNVKGVESDIKSYGSKSTIENNLNYIKEFTKRRFSYNHYFLTKESQYKNIEKKFLIEKLLKNSDGTIPNDYKFHCFNGEVLFIYVSIDREGGNYRKIYYPDWSHAPFTWTNLGSEYKFDGADIDKPENLDEMIEIAERLSSEFQYIRVDLYNSDEGVFVGELTQHQGSGFEPILPYEYDLFYGSKIVI